MKAKVSSESPGAAPWVAAGRLAKYPGTQLHPATVHAHPHFYVRFLSILKLSATLNYNHVFGRFGS
jgi:hypothetical protein